MPFSYRPLQLEGLRLLRPVWITHDVLTFEISHHLRKAAPPYTAVSYTWGDGQPTEQITLNGQRFPVRVNLWSCLHYLGGAVKYGQDSYTYLWVDAICIDHSNTGERNSQVRFMDQIYRNATVVSVWLGLPPIPDFLKAGLVNYHKPIKTYEDDGFDWSDSIEYLANRSYWSRFWVIQEFLLAQKVHLYCGNSRVDWEAFRDILGCETGVQDFYQENVDYSRSPSGLWKAWPLVTGRHPDKHPELQQSLYKLLITHECSQYQNPRDRVFALIGLVTLEERALLERFLPDYNMTEDDVVLIALCHVRLNVGVFEQGSIDVRRLLLALGVDSEARQKRLIRRTDEFDYLGDEPPSAYPDWFCDQEISEFDVSNWGRISDPELDELDIRNWGGGVHRTRQGRARRQVKQLLLALGFVLFLMGLLKIHPREAWARFMSSTLQKVARLRKSIRLAQA